MSVLATQLRASLSNRIQRFRHRILASADDATLAYVTAVEAADGQQLENHVLAAMVTFANWRIPLGGACYLMAGARTLAGALTPMLGPAPTGVNLVEGDYSRITGIKGNASTKSVALNYNNGTYGSQDDRLAGVWLSEKDTTGFNLRTIIGSTTANGRFYMRTINGPGPGEGMQYAINNFTATVLVNYVDGGLLVVGRQDSANNFIYNNGTTQTSTFNSQAPDPFALNLFCSLVSEPASFTDARIAMFTDSAYIDPAVLDVNTTAAVNAIGAALG